jgi:putative heme degradation protein
MDPCLDSAAVCHDQKRLVPCAEELASACDAVGFLMCICVLPVCDGFGRFWTAERAGCCAASLIYHIPNNMLWFEWADARLASATRLWRELLQRGRAANGVSRV